MRALYEQDSYCHCSYDFIDFYGIVYSPTEVETIRWVQVDLPEDTVWSEVSDPTRWNRWQPWASDESSTVIQWDGGVATVTKVDAELKSVDFDVPESNGEGSLYLEKKPEGLWIRCRYAFQAEYAPIARLQGWMHRSEVALKLDDGLLKLKQQLEMQEETE